MRKVCYGSRSMRGIETTEIITTVYSTCELRGVNPYTFMADYLGGQNKINTNAGKGAGACGRRRIIIQKTPTRRMQQNQSAMV